MGLQIAGISEAVAVQQCAGDGGQPHDAQTDGLNSIQGQVKGKSFAGNLMKTFVVVGDDHEIVVESRPHDSFGEPGEQVQVTWEPKDAIVLTA